MNKTKKITIKEGSNFQAMGDTLPTTTIHNPNKICVENSLIIKPKIKESWEEEWNRFVLDLIKYHKLKVSRNFTTAISRELKKTIKERESKYLKVLREIDAIFSGEYRGYDMEHQEILKIIKDNNIEL